MSSLISSTTFTSRASSDCCSSRDCTKGGLDVGNRKSSRVSAKSAHMVTKSLSVRLEKNH